MTDQPDRLFQQLTSTRHFLLAKTDKQLPHTSAGEETALCGETPVQDITVFFPDLPVGDQLHDRVKPRLEAADHFVACAIRPDLTCTNKETATKNLFALTAAIEHLCAAEDGLWGILDRHLFGCFFPGKTDAFLSAIPDRIRSGLTPKQIPVTIGTAQYPTLDYPRDVIMGNAVKAVEHALFFGMDSTAAFDDVSLNISGDNFFQQGDIPLAMTEFESALALNDRNVNVRNSLGVCHGLMGDLEQARRQFAAAVCCDGREFMALYNLGLIHMLLNDRHKAIDYFKKAQKAGGDIFEVVYQTGRLLVELGIPEEGRAYLERAVDMEPDSAPAHRVMGDCLTQMNELGDAAAAYKRAVKLNPEDAAALSALGALYDRRGENTEIATLYCKKSVQLVPGEGLFHLRLARLYEKQHNTHAAERAFKMAADLGHAVDDIPNASALPRNTG